MGHHEWPDAPPYHLPECWPQLWLLLLDNDAYELGRGVHRGEKLVLGVKLDDHGRGFDIYLRKSRSAQMLLQDLLDPQD